MYMQGALTWEAAQMDSKAITTITASTDSPTGYLVPFRYDNADARRVRLVCPVQLLRRSACLPLHAGSVFPLRMGKQHAPPVHRRPRCRLVRRGYGKGQEWCVDLQLASAQWLVWILLRRGRNRGRAAEGLHRCHLCSTAADTRRAGPT